VSTTDWPQVQRDPQHTGFSPETLGTNFQVAWTYAFQPEKVYPGTQAIVYAGRAYVGTEMGNLYAINAGTSAGAGSKAWSYAVNSPILNSVAAANGKVYFGAMDGAVYALDAGTGALAWKRQASDRLGFSTAPVIAEGKVMLGGRNGVFYALNPADGTVLWSFDAKAPILMTAAYDQGKVVFTTNDMYVYALNAANGQQVWKSARIPGRAFKDYYPVITQGKVILRPFPQGDPLAPLNHSDAEQSALLARYDANPSAYSKSMFVLDAATGLEAPAILHWDTQSMNGPLAPPCVDRDGYIIQPLIKDNSWEGGWGRFDVRTRKLVQALDDGTGAGFGNVDESYANSCSQNLVLTFHVMERMTIAAGYNGFFDLVNRRWTQVPGGMRSLKLSNLTQGGGGNAPSIANGMVYHIALHELVARTTR
jgi:hypothetical protein